MLLFRCRCWTCSPLLFYLSLHRQGLSVVKFFFLVQSVAVLIELSSGKARGFDRVLFFLFTFPLIRCFFCLLLSFNGMLFFLSFDRMLFYPLIGCCFILR